MLEELERGVTVFGHALELLVNNGTIMNLNSNLSCNGTDDLKWEIGDRLFRYTLLVLNFCILLT